jgi:hypothetical protein
MANAGFLWPLYEMAGVTYTPAFSGGDWEATLPLTNLADRRLAKVARSSDTELASTRLHLDLGVARSIGGIAIPKHTLSKTGAYVRAMAQVSELLFDYEAGDDITVKGGTFARALAAYYLTRSSAVLRQAATGVIRDAHFESTVRATRLELARTNICLQSQTFGTTWAPTRATISSNTVAAPDGTTTADSLVEDATAASTHYVQQSGLTITSNATVAVSCYVKAAGRSWVRLQFIDATGTDGFAAYFNLSTGATGATVNTGAGVLATKRITAIGSSSWYHITVTGAVNNARTSIIKQIHAAEGDSDITFDGNSTAALYLWGAQVEDSSTFATSYIPTTTVGVARPADALYFDLPSGLTTPVAATFYLKFVERGTVQVANQRIQQIGDTGSNNNALRIVSTGTAYTAILADAAGAATSSSTAAATPAFGDTVELRVTVSSTGVVQMHQSINGAAEVSATAGAAGGLPATWGTGSAKIFVGTVGTNGASQGAMSLISLRIMSGSSNSLATMQASVYDSGWTAANGSGLDAEASDGINLPWVLIPSAAQSARYWSIQLDDYSNVDGYVDLARLVVGGLYQPDVNMLTGATMGLNTDTERKSTDGGAAIYNAKPIYRTCDFELDHIAETEAMTETWRMQRLLGTHGQFFFVFDTEDTYMQERSFLATLEQLGGLQYPYSIARRKSVFRVKEEL